MRTGRYICMFQIYGGVWCITILKVKATKIGLLPKCASCPASVYPNWWVGSWQERKCQFLDEIGNHPALVLKISWYFCYSVLQIYQPSITWFKLFGWNLKHFHSTFTSALWNRAHNWCSILSHCDVWYSEGLDSTRTQLHNPRLAQPIREPPKAHFPTKIQLFTLATLYPGFQLDYWEWANWFYFQQIFERAGVQTNF